MIETFGPTLVAIAIRTAAGQPPRRALTESKTYQRLGYVPMDLDEGLAKTVAWFREVGKID